MKGREAGKDWVGSLPLRISILVEGAYSFQSTRHERRVTELAVSLG